jgi:hypothetical protein
MVWRNLGIEELVGLLDGYDQGPRFFAGGAESPLFHRHIALVDAPGQEIGHQQIGAQVVAVTTELQDHTPPRLEVLQNAAHRVLIGPGGDELITPVAVELAPQRCQGGLVQVQILGQGPQPAACLGIGAFIGIDPIVVHKIA